MLTLTPLSFSIRAEPAEGETEAASDRAAYQPDRAAQGPPHQAQVAACKYVRPRMPEHTNRPALCTVDIDISKGFFMFRRVNMEKERDILLSIKLYNINRRLIRSTE